MLRSPAGVRACSPNQTIFTPSSSRHLNVLTGPAPGLTVVQREPWLPSTGWTAACCPPSWTQPHTYELCFCLFCVVALLLPADLER